MPRTATFEQAAAVPLAALTAWQALVDTAKLTAGRRVLITAAAGGVGHFAVQFAKHLGAYVIAVAGPRNQERLAGLGAGAGGGYTSKRVSEQGRAADLRLDPV